ncbi:MAG: pirin family protein [Cyclobacteriaceae bacterium]
MSVQIIKKQEQATGAFDFGRILENKPLGFPHEGGLTKPFSNLFYWAHAWSDTGGLIGEHPHQGFEIMSYVIDGTISHYDNKMATWKNLSKGDAQLIKAGNGITHAEKLLPGAHIFQIWFDPNLRESLKKPANYIDITADKFPVEQNDSVSQKVIVGEGSPLDLDSVGIGITEYTVKKGGFSLPVSPGFRYGVYTISGEVEIDQGIISADDYLLVSGESEFNVRVNEDAKLFVIAVQDEVDYKTYAQSQRVG